MSNVPANIEQVYQENKKLNDAYTQAATALASHVHVGNDGLLTLDVKSGAGGHTALPLYC